MKTRLPFDQVIAASENLNVNFFNIVLKLDGLVPARALMQMDAFCGCPPGDDQTAGKDGSDRTADVSWKAFIC